jgi:preprotein translocase subunit SecG
MLRGFILGVHVLLALMIIGLVLLQRGKGADAGAGFGSGASGTVFGARGSATFFSKTTAVLASCFFVTSLALAYMASHRSNAPKSLLERVPVTAPAPAAAPAAPLAPPAAAGDLPAAPPAAPPTAPAPATPTTSPPAK